MPFPVKLLKKQFLNYNFRSQGGDTIVGHRRSMRKSEESARRSHKYTNDVMMRSAVPSKSYVRFLNSTIEIDNKSGIRELEIFFEVTHADGSKKTHSYSGTIQPEKDYSVEVKEQISRFINKHSYNYISSDDTLVQGVLNILMEFEDAPHYCHNKTIVVFKPTTKQQFDDQISEAIAEISRIEDDYYNLYEENKRAFVTIKRSNERRGMFSINSNRKFGSISKDNSPINLKASNLPSKISLKHPNTSALNQEKQRISKDQLCDGEMNLQISI